MEKDLGQLGDIDDNEYFRYLSSWLAENQMMFLDYSSIEDVDYVNRDKLYEALKLFEKLNNKF